VNEDELRALIREAVARHQSTNPQEFLAPRSASGPVPHAPSAEPRPFAAHPSHYQYLALVNVGEACVIEPDVSCNHCGYCRSHGH
jgi:hypothetical protein